MRLIMDKLSELQGDSHRAAMGAYLLYVYKTLFGRYP